MKIFSSTIRLNSKNKQEEIRITDQVQAILAESEITEGTAFIFTGHTTTALHLNNTDSALEKDFHEFLNNLVPNNENYKHNKGEYGRNADAHLKSVLIGNAVTVPITRGRLALGQWQTIYFSEFDGPRARLVSVKITGK
ncbi:MAG: secondary thiamine-phosphate synthase enzyme YjbQ [Deltaproteobacteria bacterium]|nr:secondary thiamine-phosphate synthase enzyme YjbQ [Deltaproteobacteria bacterium]